MTFPHFRFRPELLPRDDIGAAGDLQRLTMLTVYDCIVSEHDLRLVALAALVCALASLTGINQLHHVRRMKGRGQLAWLAIAAASTGFGIWATHFIAMLAFSPSLPTAYNVTLTGIGLGTALLPGLAFAPWIGGAIVGGGIAVMYYTGMAAFEVAGTIAWNSALVAASILLGGLLGAMALATALNRSSRGITF